jgi:hypothetical protein
LAIHVEESGKYYGRYLLWLSIGLAKEINDFGVACRFLTVDADISADPSVPEFYEKNGLSIIFTIIESLLFSPTILLSFYYYVSSLIR